MNLEKDVLWGNNAFVCLVFTLFVNILIKWATVFVFLLGREDTPDWPEQAGGGPAAYQHRQKEKVASDWLIWLASHALVSSELIIVVGLVSRFSVQFKRKSNNGIAVANVPSSHEQLKG